MSMGASLRLDTSGRVACLAFVCLALITPALAQEIPGPAPGRWRIVDADDGRVMRSYTPGVSAPTSGDVNGDGLVNFEDLNAVLGAWGAQGEGLAQDVNGDGTVDFADLNVVLGAFNGAA